MMDLIIKQKMSLDRFYNVEVSPALKPDYSIVHFRDVNGRSVYEAMMLNAHAVELLNEVTKMIAFAGLAHSTVIVFDSSKFFDYKDSNESIIVK